MIPRRISVDEESRQRYLASTVATLWPDDGGLPQPGTSRVTLPSSSRPRVYAPARPRRAAASAFWRYSTEQTSRDRVIGALVAGAVWVGAWGARPQPELVTRSTVADIDAYLGEVLGCRAITSLAVTRERANRKPVLQVFDEAGHTIAFAKVGISELSARLIANEAAALEVLAGQELHHVRVPSVLGFGKWQDYPVLTLAAMPTAGLRGPSPELLDRAMVEVSAVEHFDPVDARSTYVDGLGGRLSAATEVGDPDLLARWSRAFDAVVAQAPHDLEFGAWHGDWTMWNCAARGDRLNLWDWERFSSPVPRGYDRLHLHLNRAGRRRGVQRDEFSLQMIERSAQLLSPWGMDGRAARATTMLYLLDIVLRYLGDDQRGLGFASAVDQWALPALEHTIDTEGWLDGP